MPSEFERHIAMERDEEDQSKEDGPDDARAPRLGQAGERIPQDVSAMFVPDGTKEEIDALAELQRMTTTAENALRIREAVDRVDVRHLLANVATPTLLLHARNDRSIRWTRAGNLRPAFATPGSSCSKAPTTSPCRANRRGT
jgi:pimeloyl-ACP methyl ester carboxylesterase